MRDTDSQDFHTLDESPLIFINAQPILTIVHAKFNPLCQRAGSDGCGMNVRAFTGPFQSA